MAVRRRWRWVFRAIDPVGTGTSLRFWQGNNGGSLHRCVSNLPIRRLLGAAGYQAAGVAILNPLFCRTIFFMAVSQVAMTVIQPVFPEVAVI